MEFPVLDNGLLAHLPISSKIVRLVQKNRFRDGSTLPNSGSMRTRYTWEWTYQNLNEDETQRVFDFWRSSSRGAACFEFVDPMANLLSATETLELAPWRQSGQLNITPLGTENGIAEVLVTNATPIAATISQTVEVNPALALLLSVRARWETQASLGLKSVSQRGVLSSSFSISGVKVCELQIPPQSHDRVKEIEFEVPGNTQVILSRPQLEVGLTSSAYLPSIRGAVFNTAWIEPDEFRISTVAPGYQSIRIMVHAER